MGIWNPKTQTGTVHYAEYSELPAKKIWSWGSDVEGRGWRKALSDNDSAYVEVQAGLFRNQETYAFLDPGQTIRFSEYWMPARGIGGISRSNRSGVVFFHAEGPRVSASLNVNERIPGAQIRLLLDKQILSNETIDLSPEKMWSHSVTVTDTASKVSFELRDNKGNMLLSHTDGKYDWDPDSTIKVGPQQIYDTPTPENRTESDWLQLGTDQELNGEILLALETYKAGLSKYSASLTLQMAAGRLAASLQRYSEAEELLQAVHKRDTANAEIAYYLGIAEDGLGRIREAQTAYEIAYRQAKFHGRAAARIGELQARQGNLISARAFMKNAADADPLDIRTGEQLDPIIRANGDTAQADKLTRLDLKMNPMSDFLKEEAGTRDLSHLSADPYRVLRVAPEYMDLGLYQRALTVLEATYAQEPPDQSEPDSVLPQNHPLVLYYAAYCKEKLGKGAVSNWQAAERLSPSLVFPSSSMDQVVLNAALEANDRDGIAHYLLGTLLFSKGLYHLGLEHWTAAKRINPKLPVLDADMGKAWLRISGDSEHALKIFREGAENDPTNPDIYVGLDEAMSLLGNSAKQRAEALGRYPSSIAGASLSTMPASLVYQLALTRAEAGQYDGALGLFEGRFFPSEEGGVNTTQILFEIKLMQAEAETASEKCSDSMLFLAADHPGLELNGAVSQAHVRMAAIARACGQPQLSEQLLYKAASTKNWIDAARAFKAETLLGTQGAAQQLQKLQSSLTAAERLKDTSSDTGWWWYDIGIIQTELHHDLQAKEAFNKVFLLPDSMVSHHLSRAAKATAEGIR